MRCTTGQSPASDALHLFKQSDSAQASSEAARLLQGRHPALHSQNAATCLPHWPHFAGLLADGLQRLCQGICSAPHNDGVHANLLRSICASQQREARVRTSSRGCSPEVRCVGKGPVHRTIIARMCARQRDDSKTRVPHGRSLVSHTRCCQHKGGSNKSITWQAPQDSQSPQQPTNAQ